MRSTNKQCYLVVGLLLGFVTANSVTGVVVPGAPEPASVFKAQGLENPESKEEGQKRCDGKYRYKFTLPEGKIFRAVLNIGWWNRVWINGKGLGFLEAMATGWNAYWTQGVDVTDLLLPGAENVIAMATCGWPNNSYLEGDVVMASGEIIHIATGPGWKAKTLDADDKWGRANQYFFRPDAPVPAWAEPGFDDSAWPEAKAIRPLGLPYLPGRIPVYSGRLVLENPSEEKLFYEDTRDIKLRVRFPVGLAEQKPVISCKVRSIPQNTEVFNSNVSEYTNSTDGVSVTVEFNVGKLPRGVYVVDVNAQAGGTNIEAHLNEGLAVFGKIPMKTGKVGAGWEQELDLQLVDTINCSAADDPHAFMQGGYGESTIVEKNGLKYREAGPGGPGGGGKPTSFFCYKVRFPAKDRPYVVVFEYPDDKERNMGLGVNGFTADAWEAIQKSKPGKMDWGAFVRGEAGGMVCGGRYPLSMKLRRMPILFYPPQEDMFVFAVTHAGNCPAALSKVQIYSFDDNELPEAAGQKSGERFLGIHTERGASFAAMTAACDWNTFNTHYISPEMLQVWFKSVERYTRYLRFAGENFHVMGCYQYNEGNTPYARPTFLRGKHSRPEPDFRDIMARMFGLNDISFMVSVEPGRMIFDKGCSDEEMAKGAETLWCVSREGKQRQPGQGYHGGIWILPNIFHPRVEEYMLKLVDELAGRFGNNPAFKGMLYWGMGGVDNRHVIVPNYISDPLDWGYEDVTIAQFETDTGIKIPVPKDDANRFAKRCQWLMENAKKQWIDWRCKRVQVFYKRHLERLQKYGPDLQTIAVHQEKKNEDLPEYFRTEGLDLSLYKDIPVAFCRELHWNGGGNTPEQYARKVTEIANDDANKVYERDSIRPAFINNGFFENTVTNTPTKDWPFSRYYLGQSAPTAESEHHSRQFTESLAAFDADTIMMSFFDGQVAPGKEEAVRNFAYGYLALPAAKLRRIEKDIDSNLIVRDNRVDNQYVFYALNPAWWKGKASVTISGGRNKVMDLSSGKEIRVDRKGAFSFELPSYSVRGFTVDNPEAEVIKAAFDLGADKRKVNEFYQEKLEKIRTQLAGRRVAQVLGPEDIAFGGKTVEEIKQLLANGEFLKAESMLYGAKLQHIVCDIAANSSWITPWLVLGQFPGDKTGEIFRKGSEVEDDVLAGKILLDKEYQGGLAANGEPVAHKWTRVLTGKQPWSGHENFMNFCYPSGVIPMRDYTIAYAYTGVRAPEDMEVFMATGSDDGIRVWLNGTLVLDKYIGRGASPAQEKTAIKLNKGWNSLLVKIDNQLGGAGFFLDFLDKDGQPLTDLDIFPWLKQ